MSQNIAYTEPSKSSNKYGVKIVILLFLLSIFILMSIDTQQNISVDQLAQTDKYTKAKYIFTWNTTKKVLIDDFKKIKMIYGYKKGNTSIEVKNDVLIVKIDNKGAILKTKNDSIDIEKDCSKMKGYMGIFTTSKQFKTTIDGKIKSIYYKPCR